MEPKDTTKNRGINRFVRFDAAPPKAELDDVAREELGETEELKRKCLDELRVLIRERRLNCKDTDDFLLRFLRVKKFHVEESFKKLLLHCDKIVYLNNLLLQLHPGTLENILNHNVFGILPYRDSNHRLIIWHKTGSWNSSISPYDDAVLTFILLNMYAAEEPSSQTTGIHMFEDSTLPFPILDGFRVIPWIPLMQKFVIGSLPLRVKQLHFMKESAFMKHLIKILRPLLPTKINKRMILHGEKTDDLFRQIHPSILPYEFSGSLGPLNNDHLVEVMKDYLKKIQDEHRDFLNQKK